MSTQAYLNRSLIAFLDVSSRDEAITELVNLLDREAKLPDRDAFLKAIFQREEIVSTGIGMGVAIPHAKMKEISSFFIAIGIQKKKGLEWNALDQAPVRVIFMIGGPDDQQSEYLQILSLITSAIRDVELRKKLLKASVANQVLELFA